MVIKRGNMEGETTLQDAKMSSARIWGPLGHQNFPKALNLLMLNRQCPVSPPTPCRTLCILCFRCTQQSPLDRQENGHDFCFSSIENLRKMHHLIFRDSSNIQTLTTQWQMYHIYTPYPSVVQQRKAVILYNCETRKVFTLKSFFKLLITVIAGSCHILKKSTSAHWLITWFP